MTERIAYVSPKSEDYEWWQIETPEFSEKFKEGIKTIPSEDRDWDNVNKVWSVREKWKLWTLNLVQKCYPGCTIEEAG